MLCAMKWMTVLVMSLVLGCGGKKEEKKEDEPGKIGGLLDRAKSIGDEVGDKAKDLAGEAKDMAGKAKDIGVEVGDKAKAAGEDVSTRAKELEIEKHAREIGDEVARRAEVLSKEAISLGKDLKAKLATSAKLSKYNYDLSVDSADESEDDYKKRFGKMKMIDIDKYKVGFERRSQHPLGKVYKWQFMAAWRLPGGRTARLSLFTDDELEELLLATMMGEILPLANLLLK